MTRIILVLMTILRYAEKLHRHVSIIARSNVAGVNQSLPKELMTFALKDFPFESHQFIRIFTYFVNENGFAVASSPNCIPL